MGLVLALIPFTHFASNVLFQVVKTVAFSNFIVSYRAKFVLARRHVGKTIGTFRTVGAESINKERAIMSQCEILRSGRYRRYTATKYCSYKFPRWHLAL